MKKTVARKKIFSTSNAKPPKRPKREHWTFAFFKRVDAWGDALKQPEDKRTRT